MKNPLVQAIPALPMERCLRHLPALWWRRHTTRQQLRLMMEQDPERLSDDLALSDFALYQECRKWFWEP